MKLIPIGQNLRVVQRPDPAIWDTGLFVARPGPIARNEPLRTESTPVENRPTTHPVLDLVYRPEVRRAISESQPPRVVRQYPPFEQRAGESVGIYLNVMV